MLTISRILLCKDNYHGEKGVAGTGSGGNSVSVMFQEQGGHSDRQLELSEQWGRGNRRCDQ